MWMGREPADWAASTISGTPRSRQIWAISRMGRIKPNTLETWAQTTASVPSVTRSRNPRSNGLAVKERRVDHVDLHIRYIVERAGHGVVFISGDHHPAARRHQGADGNVQGVGGVEVKTTFSGSSTPKSAATSSRQAYRASAARAALW